MEYDALTDKQRLRLGIDVRASHEYQPHTKSAKYKKSYANESAKRSNYLSLDENNPKRQGIEGYNLYQNLTPFSQHEVAMYQPDNDDDFENLDRPPFISQLNNMPKRRSDVISSVPSKKPGPSRASGEKVQVGIHRVLAKPLKGIGYLKPGSVFANKPRTLSHQFAFDLSSSLGLRAVCATFWRHGYSGYGDADDTILSPAQLSNARTYDSITINSAVRNGSSNIIDSSSPYADIKYSSSNYPKSLFASTNLWDLEIASWNAKALKMVNEIGTSLNTSSTTNFGNLQVYQDYYPPTDHSKGTPFLGVDSSVGGPQTRPPFLVHLGPGYVSYSCQNRLPTNAEVEFVVYQIRDIQQNNAATSWVDLICDYANTSMKEKLLSGPKLTSQTQGSGGTAYADYDNLMDPDYKLLASYPKFMPTQSPCIEKDRVKFILGGGSTKVCSFSLPEQIYNSQLNSQISGDSFSTVPTAHVQANTLTYIIFVAVNGVLMPTFIAPTANNTNTTATTDINYQSIVDRAQCPANVMFTGTYTEKPMPCLSTSPDRVYNNYPMLSAVDNYSTSSTGFVSGLVASMPVSTATGNTIVFSKIANQLAISIEKIEGG